MKKLLLILLCLPIIGFGQYEVEKGSQERIDISNAIRTSFGTEYLCVYSQLEVLDRFAFASFKLIHKLTNKFMIYEDFYGEKLPEEFNILLINDFDKGWQVYNKGCYDWTECLDTRATYKYFSEIHFKNGDYLQAIKSIDEIILWADNTSFHEEDMCDEYIKYQFKCQNESLIPINDTLFAFMKCKKIYTYDYLLDKAWRYNKWEEGGVQYSDIIYGESIILRDKYLDFAIKKYGLNGKKK